MAMAATCHKAGALGGSKKNAFDKDRHRQRDDLPLRQVISVVALTHKSVTHSGRLERSLVEIEYKMPLPEFVGCQHARVIQPGWLRSKYHAFLLGRSIEAPRDLASAVWVGNYFWTRPENLGSKYDYRCWDTPRTFGVEILLLQTYRSTNQYLLF